MLRFFLCVLLLGTAQIVNAAEWKKVERAGDGTTILIDSSSIKRAAVSSVWIEYDYTTKVITDGDRKRAELEAQLAQNGIYADGPTISMMPPSVDITPDHMVALWLIKCADHQYATGPTNTYNAVGQVIKSERGDTPAFTAIFPDTIGETIERELCAN